MSGLAVAPGAGLISSAHLGHSELAIVMATGEPSVRPWRTPPRIVTSSRSKRWRGPRPYPRRRGQLALEVLDGDAQPRGQPFDDDAEGLAVGLAAVEEAQHGRAG